MQVKSINSPHQIPVTNSSDASSKARAVAAFNRAATPEAQAQQYSVPNPNQVRVEDLSALNVPQEPKSEEIPENQPIQPNTETTPEAPKEDPALSRQFAQLARQERAIRAKQQQQDQAFKQREADLKAREDALNKPQFDPNEYIPRSRIKEDAYSVLVEEGVDLDQTYQRHMQRAPVDPQVQSEMKWLKAEVERLKSQSETSQKSYEKQQQDSYQAAIKQIRSDAEALVKANPQDYETIAKTNTINDVVDLIEQTYKKDGIVLSVEEAAKEVEDHVAEELYKHASNIDKIKKRLNTAAQPKATDEKKPAQQQQPQMKTLTNAAASSRKLSAKERAILAFKGELKP